LQLNDKKIVTEGNYLNNQPGRYECRAGYLFRAWMPIKRIFRPDDLYRYAERIERSTDGCCF